MKRKALIHIGHALMSPQIQPFKHVTSETQACHNLQPISDMSTSQSNNTFKQVCRQILKLQQNIMNYVFLSSCAHWHWKLRLPFHPDTANMKNVHVAVILTLHGHKILKLCMVFKDKNHFKTKFIIPCSYFSTKTHKSVPKYMLNKIKIKNSKNSYFWKFTTVKDR
jgi:hypothetical protein